MTSFHTKMVSSSSSAPSPSLTFVNEVTLTAGTEPGPSTSNAARSSPGKVVGSTSNASTQTGVSNGVYPGFFAFPARRRNNSRLKKLRESFWRSLTFIWNYFIHICQDPTIFANGFLKVFKLSACYELDSLYGKIKYFPFECVFRKADTTLVTEVAKEEERSLESLAWTSVKMIAFMIFMHFWISDLDILYSLVFMPTNTNLNFFPLLTNVIVADFFVKYGTITVKMLITALPGSVLDFSERGNIYNFIEMSSQLYRSVLPLPVWLIHFTTAYSSWSLELSIFGILYALCKITCSDSRKRLKNWREALDILMETKWKTSSSSLEVLEEDATLIEMEMKDENDDADCAICHSDFVNPMMLKCKHMFCRKCITTWFKFQGPTQAKHTCPLCCSEVVIEDVVKFKDGSTLSTIIHL